MRPLTRTLIAAAASVVSLALAAGPALAVPTVTLRLGTLARGADPAVPHVEGRTIVDGSVRIAVQAGRVSLIGTSGTAYVVGTSTKYGNKARLLRVDASGAVVDLGPGYAESAVLSEDGQRLVTARGLLADATVVKVRSTLTGATVTKKRFVGYPYLIAADAGRVLLSTYPRGIESWDTTTGAVTRVTRRTGFRADLGHDLLASFTKDVYNGGCTVVSRLSNPKDKLWKSCDEAVYEFSADGSHIATVGILTDGIGPNRVTVRTVTGTEVGSYKTKRNGYFGALEFEDADTLLLETTSRRKVATVRCTGAVCELASDLTRAAPIRLS